MGRIVDVLNFQITNVGNLAGSHGGEVLSLSGDGIWAVGQTINTGSGQTHAIRQRGSIALNGKWTTSGSLTDMGMLPGGAHNTANGISLDGQMVVGAGDTTGTSTSNRPWRWTVAGGFTILTAVLPNTSLAYSNVARAVSANGEFIYGESPASTSEVPGFPNVSEAAQWAAGTGYNTAVGLGIVTNYVRNPGDTPATYTTTEAMGCSADGQIVVGNVSGQVVGPLTTVDVVFRWTASTGMTFLPVPTDWLRMTIFNRGISADGTTIVGQGIDINGHAHAFRWTAATGTVDLGLLPGGVNAQANECSGDGTIVVGSADDANGVFHGFWWRADTGMVQLPDLPGGSSAEAFCCSTNGCIIGGTAKDSGGTICAAVWSLVAPQSNVTLPPVEAPFDPPAVDYLMMVTEDRTIDPHFVERLTRTFELDNTLEDAWFVDAAVQATAFVDQGTGVKFYGLWHLRGATNVSAWVSGIDCGTFTVDTDGTLFVPYGADAEGAFTQNKFWGSQRIARIGYSYLSQGQLLKPGTAPEAGSANGPPAGKVRRSQQFSALLANTVGVSFGTDFSKLRAARFTTLGGTPYTKEQMFSGVWWDTIDDTYSLEGGLCWQVDRPYPCTIVQLGGFLATQDR